LVKARIRGIYSTALTRLLLDEGFKIVQPSAVIRERFKLDESKCDAQPDIDIYDRVDRQGINAGGSPEAIDTLASILLSKLDDVVIRKRGAQQYVTEAVGIGSSSFLSAEFPSLSKRRLDSIRSLVAPTLEGHHYYRACGGRISSLLEMAERLLEQKCPLREVETLFKETIKPYYPREGSAIEIEHVKVIGYTFNLGEAKILEFDEESSFIRLRRRFIRRGMYDGLRVRKEYGDYAITDLRIGEWSLKTRYFSKDDEYKGTYINLNTPIELYPRSIRYVDLEVDICVWPNGSFKVLDEEKLQLWISRGFISPKVGDIVRDEVKALIESIDLSVEKVPP